MNRLVDLFVTPWIILLSILSATLLFAHCVGLSINVNPFVKSLLFRELCSMLPVLL